MTDPVTLKTAKGDFQFPVLEGSCGPDVFDVRVNTTPRSAVRFSRHDVPEDAFDPIRAAVTDGELVNEYELRGALTDALPTFGGGR